MSLKKCVLLYCLLLLFIDCFAQTGTLPVKITLEKSGSGDSLWVTASVNAYSKPSSLMFIASLEDTQAKDTFFLPLIDSVANYCFIYPLSMQENLLLQAYFSPGIFKVSGAVNDHKRSSGIKAILITDNDKIYNKEISFIAENRFELPSMVFEKKASLAFNYTKDNRWKGHPDVTISIFPALKDFRELIFSSEIKRGNDQNTEQPGKKKIIKTDLENGVKADSQYKTLKSVEVAAVRKKNIEKFNDEYSTGLFRDPSEILVDCIDNSNILACTNCINYLQTQVPGLSISTDQSGDMIVKWRGHEMKAFYIDEIRVDMEQLLGVNPAEIAMLKVYPPPFFGSSSGDGGAIALYTRRGEYGMPVSKSTNWLFTIKGYAPPVNTLFEENKKL